ncbi:C40 family peptidase [Clostridium sp.]|uniref:C40 family peptidase n=1 Tax=Clostridium sp. TaxID=1506 RepID=UPI002FCC6E7D
MSNKKLIKTFFTTLIFTFIIIGTSNADEVKADVVVKVNTEVIVKTVNLSTGKTIKVPDREAERNSYSRGGNLNVPEEAYEVVQYAKQHLGKPYVWAAEGPNAFDCSGFTKFVYENFGFDLPHYTHSQIRMGTSISRDKLSPGDLVFFNTDGAISHVGIYTGGSKFIHAASSGKVMISDLDSSYYTVRYAGARRIF